VFSGVLVTSDQSFRHYFSLCLATNLQVGELEERELIALQTIRSGKMFFASFLLFSVLATAGMSLARLSHDVAVFWPANAAMVSLCLIYGLSNLPAVLLGGFLANITMQLAFGDPMAIMFGLPLANSIEILLVTFGLWALNLDQTPIDTPKSFMQFLAVLVLLGLPGALIGATTLHLGIGLPFFKSLTYWWAGDMVSSIIVLLPLLSAGWPQKFSISFDRDTLLPSLKYLAILLSCTIFGLIGLYALQLPVALAFMAPSCLLALQGKPFKVAAVGSVLVVVVSLTAIFGWLPANSTGLRIREQVFEAQFLTLLAVLPSYAISVAICNLAQSRRQIENSNMRLSVTLAHMNQGVSCFNKDYKLTVWNDKYVNMFGMEHAQVYEGASFGNLLTIQKNNGDFHDKADNLLHHIMQHVRAGEEFVSETEMSDGRIIKSVHSPTPLGGWIGTHEDITEMRALEKGLAYESRHDPLTGLPNRRYFDEELKSRLDAPHDARKPLTLFFVDLDYFKQINDNVGHNAGDAALRHIGRSIRENIDESDFVARLGGDEFAIVSTRFSSLAQAEKLAENLNTSLRVPFYYGGQPICCDVSIGITLGHGKGIDVERLRAEADLALYGAKRAGRGQHQVYRPKGKVA
jgi:diguanylate cyclase (GGDEF)-like protein